MKETYNSIKFILDAVKYEDHERPVCCALQVVSFLPAVQETFNMDSFYANEIADAEKDRLQPRAEGTLLYHHCIYNVVW